MQHLGEELVQLHGDRIGAAPSPRGVDSDDDEGTRVRSEDEQ